MDDTAAGTTPGPDGEAVTAGDGFVVERRSLQIEWVSSGPLVPWLGPAIRGIVATRLRDAVCTWPAPLRATQWLYCRGCPSMAGCGYGRLFEPDGSLAGRDSVAESIRAVVMSPGFPQPPRAVPGGRMPLSITTIGAVDEGWVAALLRALAEAGAAGVLGPGGIRFRVVPPGDGRDRRLYRAADFGAAAVGAGGVPTVDRVAVDLDGPLFLRRRDGGSRTTLCDAIPFMALLESALRTVRQCSPDPLPRLPEAVMAAAARVRGGADGLRRFSQEKASRRSGQRILLHGVTGRLSYADVPRDAVAWLEAAGRIHVGAHRVAGAGGWTLRAGATHGPASSADGGSGTCRAI